MEEDMAKTSRICPYQHKTVRHVGLSGARRDRPGGDLLGPALLLGQADCPGSVVNKNN